MPSLVFDNLFSWTPIGAPTPPASVADSSPTGFGDALQRASQPLESPSSSEPAADSDAFSSSADSGSATAGESTKQPATSQIEASGDSSTSTPSHANYDASAGADNEHSKSLAARKPTDSATSGGDSTSSSEDTSNSTTRESTSTTPSEGGQSTQPWWRGPHRFTAGQAGGRSAGAPATTGSSNSPATGNSGDGKPAPLATVQEIAASSTDAQASNSGDAAAVAGTIAAAAVAAHRLPDKPGTTSLGTNGTTATNKPKSTESASAPIDLTTSPNDAVSGDLGEILTAEHAALVSGNAVQGGKPSHPKTAPAQDTQPHAGDQAAAGSADSPSAASQQLVTDVAANLPAAPSADTHPTGPHVHANDPGHGATGSTGLDLLAASASAAAAALPTGTAPSDPSATSAGGSSNETIAPVTTANNSAQSPLAPITGVGQPTTPNSAATAGSSSGSSNGGSGSSVGDVDRVRFVQRVARAFQAADQEGGQIRLRLSPPDLGSVKLQISVQGGSLTAHVETETSSARTLLLDNLPALRERLAEHNIKIEQFDINLMNHSGGDAPGSFASGYRDSQQQGGAAAPRRTAPATESPPTAAAVAGSTVSTHSSGAINLLV